MSSADENCTPWYRSTLAFGLAGSVLLWAALPPLALGWLAWIAPVPWLLLVRTETLPGRRPYRALWLAGFAFWLMAIHWLRLPHPALHLGWLALSAYLAFYLPVFVGLSRVAVHRIGVPLWLAAPTVWAGLELVRAHLLTGFLMGSIAHTQAGCSQVIQFSDLVGEYGVDFLVMLVAASISSALPIAASRVVLDPGRDHDQNQANRGRGRPGSLKGARFRPIALVPAIVAIAAALGYGHWRLRESDAVQLNQQSQPHGLRIALIQGNSLAEWKQDPSRERQIMDEYIRLSEQAVAAARQQGDGQPLDLIVWPETMFRTGLVTFDPGYPLPPEASRTTDEITAIGLQDLARLVDRLGTPVLVGIDRAHFPAAASPTEPVPPPRRYNSAALVDRAGNLVGTYDKVHRVMFGEYIPFAKWLPVLYQITPLTGGIEPGSGPVLMPLDNSLIAPSICYETVIPHVIRRQANTLLGGSVPADVLINMTNDAWYWGSSELDMHLACGVFRAIETRKPLLIAANGGISAWIDQYGRIRAQSPRRQTDIILADVERRYMTSWYVKFGDWFAGVCLALTAVVAIVGWRSLNQTRRQGDKEIGGARVSQSPCLPLSLSPRL
jgi:apolipoprotein N-acyltransferase